MSSGGSDGARPQKRNIESVASMMKIKVAWKLSMIMPKKIEPKIADEFRRATEDVTNAYTTGGNGGDVATQALDDISKLMEEKAPYEQGTLISESVTWDISARLLHGKGQRT
ncbi:hypothetical protein VE02_06662 [Pseudogymnoascus sp. 03VT05]|nr:hypothetical protein VE02_06662 [Pseudogymnoascus sp. 03VT05]